MVLDAADHDTWSAGSFFTNPVRRRADAVPDGAPAWPQPDGTVKTSAAWLIEHAGFAKGLRRPAGVGLSTKHTLALTNRGGATTADLLALAREVRDGVERALRHPARQRAGAGRLRAASPQPVSRRAGAELSVASPEPRQQRDEAEDRQRCPAPAARCR